jgi:hypothetical protein
MKVHILILVHLLVLSIKLLIKFRDMNTTKTGFTLFLTNTSNTEAEQARFYVRCLTCSMKGVKMYTKIDTAN